MASGDQEYTSTACYVQWYYPWDQPYQPTPTTAPSLGQWTFTTGTTDLERGWLCPRCDKVNAPSKQQCDCED